MIAGGSASDVSDGFAAAPLGITLLSNEILSFDERVIILGFAADLSSEYSGPPMLSSAPFFDSALLASPALEVVFTSGIGCLPGFCFSVLAFFAGTACSPSWTSFASSEALQQLRNDRKPPLPLPFTAPTVGSCATAATASFFELLLAKLPLRLFGRKLPLESLLKMNFGPVVG